MLITANIIEIAWCLFGLWGAWKAGVHLRAVLNDQDWVRQSGINGIRKALTGTDVRIGGERFLALLCFLAVGVVSLFAPEPQREALQVLQWAGRLALIAIYIINLVGTYRDTAEREHVRELIEARNGAGKP